MNWSKKRSTLSARALTSNSDARTAPNFEILESRTLFSAATVAIAQEYVATAHELDAFGTSIQSLIGAPTSGVFSVPGIPGAQEQMFHDNAAIYWSAQTGAHIVGGAIGYEYNVTLPQETDAYGHNARAVLGLPTTDEINISKVPGARENIFSGGVIIWSPATGAHAVYGGIENFYQSTGGAAGPLGLPTYDEGGNPFDNLFRTQYFQKGEIIWNDGTVGDGFWGTLPTASGGDSSHPPFPIEKTINK